MTARPFRQGLIWFGLFCGFWVLCAVAALIALAGCAPHDRPELEVVRLCQYGDVYRDPLAGRLYYRRPGAFGGRRDRLIADGVDPSKFCPAEAS